MANDDISILIRSLFDAKGATEARKAIEALAAASKKGGAAAPGLNQDAAAASKVAAAANQAAIAAQKLAQAESQAGAAAQRLATEEQRTAVATANAAAAGAKAEKAALSLASAQQRAGAAASGASGYFDKMGQAMTGSLLGIVGPAAIAGATIAAMKGSFDLAQVGASVQAVEQSFQALARSANTSGDALLAKMHAAAQGTISDAALMQSANTGLLLTNGKIATELPRLLEIARASAKATGQDVAFVFDSLVRGIARGSPMIIDNAGITLNASAAFETYAKSIGKSVDSLSKAEQQQATLNAVVAAGGDIIAKTGGATESNATLMAQGTAQIENAKNAFAGLAANGIAPVVAGWGAIAGAIMGTDDALANGIALIGMTTEQQATLAATQIQAAQAAQFNAAAFDEDRMAIGELQIATQTAQAAVLETNAAMLTSAQASVQDAAAKEAQAAVTQLVEAQTRMAAQAFMALNPNIDGAGVASSLAAGKISASVAAYIQMTLAAANARAQLAALQNQAGMGAKGGGAVVDRGARLHESIAKDAAERDRTLAVGTTQQKLALYQQEYQAAVKRYGGESSQAYAAQTKILQAQQTTAAKGASAGNAAATKRANAAQAGADRLAAVEQSTGNKLEDIDRATQAKLIAIDEKAAAARAAAARKLAADIASATADRRASNEANDLDLIGVSDPKDAAKLNDRERAEADARKRSEEAAAEARSAAEAGEAESAGKIYDIRQQQIGNQQALDEAYYARQRELAGDPAALEALTTQYDEATRAYAEQAQVRIDLAKAEAGEKAAAAEAEKASVIAAAEDQKNQVIGRAQQSAEGVKKASGDARAKAVADLQAIGSAVNAIPTQKTITVTTVQSGAATGSAPAASSGGAYAGGGSFTTRGPTSITVGDNPGGVELVTVTPISGSGQTRHAPGTIAMAGGGTVVAAGGGYTTPVAGSDAPSGGKGGGSKGGAAGTKSLEAAAKALRDQVAILSDIARLRLELARPLPPIDAAYVRALASESARVGTIVDSVLLPITKANNEKADAYAKAASTSVSILSAVQGLRDDLLTPHPPIDEIYIRALAQETQRIGAIVGGVLLPITEYDSLMLERYGKAVSDSVGLLSDVQSLRDDLLTPHPPIDEAYVRALAAESLRTGKAVGAVLVPITEENARRADMYAASVGNTVSILNDIQGLRETLEKPHAPIDDAYVRMLADESARVSQIVGGALIPTSEETAKNVDTYAAVVGRSVSVLKDVAELNGTMFADYRSPTDAQMALLITDADRMARALTTAASAYDTKGLEAAKQYNEAIGGTFSAFKDGLLFFEALNSGDFQLDPAKLSAFERATVQTLAVTARLGKQAAAIPIGDIAALQTTTAALSAQSEALIKLAAVPWGDIGAGAAGLAQNGGALLAGAGGGGGNTIYMTVQAAPGMSVDQVAEKVYARLGGNIQNRRA